MRLLLQRAAAAGCRSVALPLSRQGGHRCGATSGAVFSALLPAALVVFGAAAPQFCRAEEEDLEEEDLQDVRRVVRTISTNTGRDPDAWVARARTAFSAVARPDGTLGREEVSEAIEKLMASGTDQSLPWELAPLLFRLLDADRDGGVSLKDFLMGQALLFAAARCGSMEQLSEVCWRSLDISGRGVITKKDLAVAVSLMLHLEAVDPHDLALIKARLAARQVRRMRNANAPGPGNVNLEAATYYMEMYDPTSTGQITRDDFEKCPALQENFKRLLTNDKVNSIFLARSMSSQAS